MKPRPPDPAVPPSHLVGSVHPVLDCDPELEVLLAVTAVCRSQAEDLVHTPSLTLCVCVRVHLCIQVGGASHKTNPQAANEISGNYQKPGNVAGAFANV